MSGEHTISSVECIFSLRGVRYLYHQRHLALDGIDLEVSRGEQVVLLGANGSGKSTLLKLLDGIYAPTEGSMGVLGRDIKAVAGEKMRSAFTARLAWSSRSRTSSCSARRSLTTSLLGRSSSASRSPK
jgi:ABC-type siderophore export system fused ATPase/permease subunit